MNRKQRIHDQLMSALQPAILSVEDESHQHRVPQDAETHFKVTVVSIAFDALSRVARARRVHSLLKTEFQQGLHALSLHLFTPEEWHQRGQTSSASPRCQHQ